MSEVPLYSARCPDACNGRSKAARECRIQGSWTFVSLNSRLESKKEEDKKKMLRSHIVQDARKDAGRHNVFCITQRKAQGPSRTCNESKEEEE